MEGLLCFCFFSIFELQVTKNLSDQLKNVTSAALVVDAWSSKNMQGVLAVRIIFLDEKFQWKLKTLSVSRISGSHTAANITEKILKVIEDWSLEGKVSYHYLCTSFFYCI